MGDLKAEPIEKKFVKPRELNDIQCLNKKSEDWHQRDGSECRDKKVYTDCEC